MSFCFHKQIFLPPLMMFWTIFFVYSPFFPDRGKKCNLIWFHGKKDTSTTKWCSTNTHGFSTKKVEFVARTSAKIFFECRVWIGVGRTAIPRNLRRFNICHPIILRVKCKQTYEFNEFFGLIFQIVEVKITRIASNWQ